MKIETNNVLYKKQGVHVITSIFTVEKGVTKVLLIKRKNNPYCGKWALVGGALYNNEDLLDGVKREIFEKTGIKDMEIYFSGVFGKVKRSPVMRMVAITYEAVIDFEKVSILKDTLKTSNADWFSINNIPELAYDHNEILDTAISSLKEKITETSILKSLFPNEFVIPEIQKVYETILNKTFDRRNFRKKILSLGVVEDTNKLQVFEGSKPAKLYKFKENSKCKNVL
ncbi:MAG: NUDIX domain-containing protein [Bacilli bacterium]